MQPTLLSSCGPRANAKLLGRFCSNFHENCILGHRRRTTSLFLQFIKLTPVFGKIVSICSITLCLGRVVRKDGNVTITNPVSFERRPTSNAQTIFKQALYQMVKFSVLLCTPNPRVKMFPDVLPQSPPPPPGHGHCQQCSPLSVVVRLRIIKRSEKRVKTVT